MNLVPTPRQSAAPAPADERMRAARCAQSAWARTPLRARLGVVRRLRHLLPDHDHALVDAVGERHGRTAADTLALEVIPLADACRFLEREAARLLAPRRLGRRGRPSWLMGVDAEVRREPLGAVLILAPGNYPLFLPGVQALQALVAGNAALIKPAPGCTAPMAALRGLLETAGLPSGLLQVLDEDVASARRVLASGVDKVILTGSAATGRAVLADLAPRLVPAAVELSGSDAVFVLPGADLDLVARALVFGLALNGGATCIAPRRVFVPHAQLAALETRLGQLISDLPPVRLEPAVVHGIASLIDEAAARGCRLIGRAPSAATSGIAPVVLSGATPDLRILREDVYAPVQALVPVADVEEALRLDGLCPYALGASIFGPVPAAHKLGARVRAGSVTINDLIVPTADSRLPFGGRDDSGYGVTRGAEGLLELTAIKTVSVRHGRRRPHCEPRTAADQAVFRHYLRAAHGPSWMGRIRSSLMLPAALSRRARALRQMAKQAAAPNRQS